MSADAPRMFKPAVVALVLSLALACPPSASAETLYEAITLAYQTSPVLGAQRAALSATDEGYVQARAGYGPQVSLSASGGETAARIQQPGGVFASATDTSFNAATGQVDLSAVQTLYTAGANRAEVAGAKASILAGRANLRETESQLILNAITAYLDVRRDRDSVDILRDEIASLTRTFEEIRAKGAALQLTRTDVAEAEARLLSAKSKLNLAMGRLQVSSAAYLKVVGRPPGTLAVEPDLPGTPAGIDDALQIAARNNPQIVAALETENAAKARIEQQKAGFGPTVSLRLDASVAPLAPYLPRQYDRSLSASVVVNQPIFTSGLNSSRVREAADRDRQSLLNVEIARRDVIEKVANAWNELSSIREAAAIQTRQVDVEEVAAKGAAIEEKVGFRTTIELLNATLELADSRISLLQSRHDEYLAKATLLAEMGMLELRYLVPNARLYDPAAAFDRVRNAGLPPWAPILEAVDQRPRIGSRPR